MSDIDKIEKADPALLAGGDAPMAQGQMLTPNTGQSKDPNLNGGSVGSFPAMTAGMEFQDVGSLGLRAFSGWVREEFLPQLQGRQAAQKYREMIDNSPVIGAINFAITGTMRKVEWRVNPADDSGEAQEMAEFVESCMDDMSHSWEDLMVENLSMLGYGFAPHEIVYKKRDGRDVPEGTAKSNYDDGRIGWRRIPIRGQDTVIKWFFDPNGEIKGMTQQPWAGPLIDIPIEKMLLFRPSQHKGNPEGKSIYRTAYVPYYFMKRMQEQEAIMGERLGGFPVISVPSNLIQAAAAGDPIATAAMAAYKRMATNIRVDEQMGAVMPSDVWQGANGPSSVRMYDLEFKTPTGGGGRSFNFDVTIMRYNTQILSSVLADFIQMGHSTRGAQNLGETKVDMFLQSVEGYLNSNASVYNRHGLPRLWRINGLDQDLMPTIEPDLAQRIDLDALSMFVLRLSQAGMPMFPSDEIQTYLLEAAGLPDIADDRALMAAGLTDEQLSIEDQKSEAALANMTAPKLLAAPTKPSTPMQKMIMASLARRMIKMQGPKFGVNTTRKRGHSHRR
jgi:hypothetical protein